MKKALFVIFLVSLVCSAGCGKDDMYLPKAKSDRMYTTVSGGEETHNGDGYTLTVPVKNYRYEKEYEDGLLEEKWEYTKKDDVEVKVTTYKNTDELEARSRFLRENDDYIFEDLTGYSLCGTERDGDTLWFNLHETDTATYIVSWKYPENTSEKLKKELADIAQTFETE